MRHKRIVLGIVAALAVVPASALAGPFWETKGPPAAWTPLAPSTKLVIITQPTMAITDKATFKDSCTGSDKEIAENPASGAPGQDEMVEFELACPVNGNGPFPCVAGEAYKLKGAANATPALPPWPSKLVGNTYDVFEKVALQVECTTSNATAVYEPPGGIWVAELLPNKLKFPSPGLFIDGAHSFSLFGNDVLKAVGFAKVR